MAIIKPFKAVRPTRDKVALVTTRSYEIYRDKELKVILKYNPYSFLHILRPGFKYKKKVTGEKRFRLVFNRFSEFKENKIFTHDEKPMYYLHQKSHEGETYWGFIAASSLADYENNVIKKHEKTLHQREALFGDYLEVVGFNAEPVLITYPDNNQLQLIYEKYKLIRSEYEFTTNKKRSHKLWLIDNEDEIKIIENEFKNMPSVYIADGHHRTASSNYLKNKLLSQSEIQDESNQLNYFMSYLIQESSLKISSFNRFIKKLNGLSKEEFLMRLDEFYRIENLEQQFYEPSKKHHFSMYLDGEYYKLYLRKSNFEIESPLDDLDPEILFKTVLKPILGIEDLSNDTNIVCLPNIENQNQLKEVVDEGRFKVGFGLFPISVQQLKNVADSNLTMPPKSTYIEPKLRSALTIFQLK